MRVHPVLIPSTSLLAKVNNEFNAVWVRGDVVGDSMYYGKGAGQDATTSAVIADIIDVALNIKHNSSCRVAAFRPHQSYNDTIAMDEVTCRYYVRLAVDDKPKVLAGITKILGNANISLASVFQKESDSDEIPVILITHVAREADMKHALKEIEALSFVHDKPVLLRIEDI